MKLGQAQHLACVAQCNITHLDALTSFRFIKLHPEAFRSTPADKTPRKSKMNWEPGLHLSAIKFILEASCSMKTNDWVFCKAAIWGLRKGSGMLWYLLIIFEAYYHGVQRISLDPDQLQLTDSIFKEQRSMSFPGKVGQGLPQLTALFPYRVSCPDQQGQTDPLITETADENESKMRPITTRAWLISLYRPLHTRWTHARSSHEHKKKSDAHTEISRNQ